MGNHIKIYKHLHSADAEHEKKFWLYQQTRGRKIAASGRSQSARPVSEICRFDGNNKFRENLKPEMPHRNGENASCFGCKTSKCVYFDSKNSSHSCCLLQAWTAFGMTEWGKSCENTKTQHGHRFGPTAQNTDRCFNLLFLGVEETSNLQEAWSPLAANWTKNGAHQLMLLALGQ